MRVNFSVGVVCMVKTDTGSFLTSDGAGNSSNGILRAWDANSSFLNTTEPTFPKQRDTCDMLQKDGKPGYGHKVSGRIVNCNKLTFNPLFLMSVFGY